MKVWENTLSGGKTVHVFRNGRAVCGGRAKASFSGIKRTAAEAESKGLKTCKRCSASPVSRNASVRTGVGTVRSDRASRVGEIVSVDFSFFGGTVETGTVTKDFGAQLGVQFPSGFEVVPAHRAVIVK